MLRLTITAAAQVGAITLVRRLDRSAGARPISISEPGGRPNGPALPKRCDPPWLSEREQAPALQRGRAVRSHAVAPAARRRSTMRSSPRLIAHASGVAQGSSSARYRFGSRSSRPANAAASPLAAARIASQTSHPRHDHGPWGRSDSSTAGLIIPIARSRIFSGYSREIGLGQDHGFNMCKLTPGSQRARAAATRETTSCQSSRRV
jgi:hypothetical protein